MIGTQLNCPDSPVGKYNFTRIDYLRDYNSGVKLMPLFLWKKSYEIGVTEIDVQHHQLVNILNELSDAMMIKEGYKMVPQVLDKLEDYIQLHFTSEERLMHSSGYPNRDEHCKRHLNMTEKILELKKKSLEDKTPDPRELLDFLCGWLRNHILVEDKALGKHIRQIELGLR